MNTATIRLPRLATWLGLLCLLPATAGPAEPSSLLDGFPRTRGILETSGHVCMLLDIWLANTPAQQRQGLMHIEKLDPHEGMLFRYARPARITMWMKNTLIPLDMLFLDARGAITGITRHTTPMSTRKIQSPGEISAVLEVNAGFADTWSVQRGNRLHIAP